LKKKCPNMPQVKFVLKYKEKRSWTSDCISVEKRSCNLSPNGRSFSMYRTVDPRQNLGPSKTRFHDKQKLERIVYLGSSKFHMYTDSKWLRERFENMLSTGWVLSNVFTK
jgi:hypothetical protein